MKSILNTITAVSYTHLDVYKRQDLLSCVGGYSHQAQSRTLDTHMKRLRQKLAPYADCIETCLLYTSRCV